MTPREFREKYNDYRPLAEEIAKDITIRTYVDGCSHDDKRPATDAEKDIICKIVYSALLAYGWSDNARLDSILDTAEFTLHQFIPTANSYDTIYIPIRRLTETW